MAGPLLIGGTLLSAYGQKRSASAQAAMMTQQAMLEAERTQAEANNLYRQAEVDRINAGLAERDSEAALLSGMIDEITLRRNNRKLLSAQRASIIANGVTGFTAEALVDQTEIEMEQDAMKLRYSGLIQSQQLQQEKLNLLRSAASLEEDAATTLRLGQASVSNMQQSARNTKAAGKLGALTTLVQGGYNYTRLGNGNK